MDTNAQIRQLRKKGLDISGNYAKRILDKENYYNLINGYKPLFIDTTYQGQGEQYKTGAKFNEIYALFLFDRELRLLFLRYILEIENNMRSIISHDFSKKYGHENYLKIDNFDKNPGVLGEVAELVSVIHRETANQIKKKNPMILHHVLSYGNIPLWVLVNIISLGTLSKFYSLLEQKDQNDIGKQFNLKPQDMKTYLKNLSLARNWCAHDERFFDKRVKSQITSNQIHESLGISVCNRGQYTAGKDDVFSIVIIFKRLLPRKEFNKFTSSINKQLNVLAGKLSTITIDAVKMKLGFPFNWLQIKDI